MRIALSVPPDRSGLYRGRLRMEALAAHGYEIVYPEKPEDLGGVLSGRDVVHTCRDWAQGVDCDLVKRARVPLNWDIDDGFSVVPPGTRFYNIIGCDPGRKPLFETTVQFARDADLVTNQHATQGPVLGAWR